MTTVLIIDDDPKMRDLVTALLETQGFYVGTTGDGEAGIALALQDRPDLVITDMNMSGVNGWEVIRRLRADPNGAGVKIVALSAFTSAADRDEAYAAGCDLYLNKPVDPPVFLEKIARFR